MYRMAGIDVHKRMLAVVVSDVEVAGEYVFESQRWGTSPAQLRLLAAWLLEQHVQEVVMESTAQYWRPVWEALERFWSPICQKQEGARPHVGKVAPGAGAIEPRTPRTQERFRRRRAFGEAARCR